MGESSTPFSSPGGGWEPPSASAVEELLEGYQIHDLLGAGGMGAVYRATEEHMDRVVAIKILPLTGLGEDEMNFAARFRHEAHSMARLSHPSVVAVYDFGQAGSEEDGTAFLFLVLEFIEGSDVQEYVKSQGGKLPPEHAHAISCHVLDGLAAAHKQNLIHRDIKPANILLDKDGRVKIADFGLAKDTDNEEWGLTQTNMAMGTPDYVAPEALITGMKVDGRADLYAVGAMLYVMITGLIPRGAFKPASQIVPGLDPRFDTIIQRALQNAPDDRYPDALQFRADLDAIMATPLAEAGAPTTALVIAESRAPKLAMGSSAAVAGDEQPKPAALPAPEKKSAKGGLILGTLVGVAAVAGLILLRRGTGDGEDPPTPTPTVVDANDTPDVQAQPGQDSDFSLAQESPDPAHDTTDAGSAEQLISAYSQGEIPVGTIDLLRLVQPEREGVWLAGETGGITYPGGTRGSRVHFKADLASPYRVELEMIRAPGPFARRFILHFPLKRGQGGSASFHLDLKEGDKSVLINDEKRAAHELFASEGDRHLLTIDVLGDGQEKRILISADGTLLCETKPGEELGRKSGFHFFSPAPAHWIISRMVAIPGIPEDLPAPSEAGTPALTSSPVPPEDPAPVSAPSADGRTLPSIPEFVTLQASYQRAMEGIAGDIGNLATKYHEALTTAAGMARSSGNLSAFNAFDSEAKKVAALSRDGTGQLDDLPADVPQRLRDLREAWDGNYAPLATRTAGLRKTYHEQLDLLVSTLTKGNRIDEANLLHSYHKELDATAPAKETEAVDSPAPVSTPVAERPPAVPGQPVALDPELVAAKAEGGRLHIHQINPDTGEPSDLRPINDLIRKKDWVSLAVDNSILYAFRANGDAIYAASNRDTWHQHGEADNVVLAQSKLLVLEDGLIRPNLLRAATKWKSTRLENPISLAVVGIGSGSALLVLDRSGETELVPGEGATPTAKMPPADWFAGVVKLASCGMGGDKRVLLALREDGTTFLWDPQQGVELPNDEIATGVTDILGLSSILVALMDDGRVINVRGGKDALPPPDAGPVVAMRAVSHAYFTYQRPDGTWFGAGSGFDDELRAAITEAGVALDLMASKDSFGGKTVIWITPE